MILKVKNILNKKEKDFRREQFALNLYKHHICIWKNEWLKSVWKKIFYFECPCIFERSGSKLWLPNSFLFLSNDQHFCPRFNSIVTSFFLYWNWVYLNFMMNILCKHQQLFIEISWIFFNSFHLVTNWLPVSAELYPHSKQVWQKHIFVELTVFVLFSAQHNPDKLDDFIETINLKLQPMFMQITKGMSEDSGHQFYALVSRFNSCPWLSLSGLFSLLVTILLSQECWFIFF